MGEAALQMGILEENQNEEQAQQASSYEDINLIALGETDQDWLYGTD